MWDGVKWTSVLSTGGPFLPLAGGDMTGPLNYVATGGTVSRSAQDRANDHGFSVLDAGAKGDWNWSTMTGTNDRAIIQALFDNPPAGGRITFPAGRQFYVGTGLIVPNTVRLYLAGQDATAALPPVSSGLVCDPNQNCLTINGSNGCVVENLTCSSRATTQPTSGAGILISGGSFITLFRTFCYNNYESYRFDSTANPGGIAGYMIEPFSAKIVRAHVVQKTWAELYISGGGRLGVGPDWTKAQAHISIEGGSTTNPASGPNSLYVSGVQMQSGDPSGDGPISFIQIVNRTPGALQHGIEAIGIHNLVMEAGRMDNIFYSDGTWDYLQRFSFTGVYLNAPDAEFWNCGPNMGIFAGALVGNQVMYLKSMTFNQTNPIDLQMSGQQLTGNVSLTAGHPDSTVSMIGMEIIGNVTLAGSWRGLTVAGGCILGTLTNTATGNVNITVPNQNNSMSGSLAVGGTSALTGPATFSNGASFGAVLASPATSLSKHIALFGADYGFNIGSGAVQAINAGAISGNFNSGWNGAVGAVTPAAGSFTTVNASGTTAVLGVASFGAGIVCGPTVGASITDLSKQICLYSGAPYGFGVTAARINYNVPGSSTHAFVVGGVDAASVNSGGVISNGLVQIGGTSGPNWSQGSAAPAFTAPVGSLYSRVGGAVGATLYVSRGGGTWAAVAGV
jgi:hypothetical protein